MNNVIIRTVLFSIILLVLILPAYGEVKYLKIDTTLESPTNFPAGIEWDGNHLWLIDRKDGLLLEVCPKSGKILNKLETPGYRPSGLAWDGKHLWISDLESAKIYRLDPKSMIISRVLDAPTKNIYGLAWDGKLLWILSANKTKSVINSIDPVDGTTIKSFKAPFNGGTGLTFDGKYLWSADRIRNELYMISPKYGNVINVLHSPGPFAYGLAWDGRLLWNVDYQTDKIYAINIEKMGNHYLWGEKHEKVIFTTVINNHGEGIIKDFNLYYAYPENQLTQNIEDIKWSIKPHKLFTDKWGQKIAHFRFTDLSPMKAEKLEMTVNARTSAIRYIIDPESIKGEVPEEIKTKYLVDELKYDINNPYIKDLAKKIVGDETNPYWKARKIFNYIIANMYYELSGGWNTAPTVLKRGNGSCSEYTFSFIALCRAVGIPARYIGTLVIRKDDASWDTVYHRWAQIYLNGYGWISVDGNRGDKEWPADQALAFGGYANSFLVTTLGGGGSKYLRFNYNYDYSYSATGRVNLRVDQVAEWEPVKK